MRKSQLFDSLQMQKPSATPERDEVDYHEPELKSYPLPTSYIQGGFDTRPDQVVPQWHSARCKGLSSFTEYMNIGRTAFVGDDALLAWACAKLAMVIRLPFIMQGGAGLGKTELADAIARLCESATYSGVTFSPQKEKGEIFGDMNVSAYVQHGLNSRDLQASSLQGHIVLLNELDKADLGIKQSLYDYVNERVYREASRIFRFDNRILVVGTVNEPLYDVPLEDRFSINMRMDDVESAMFYHDLKQINREWVYEGRGPRDLMLTSQHIEKCRATFQQAFDNFRALNTENYAKDQEPNVAQHFMRMIDKIIAKGIYVSKRKIVHLERVVCGWAAMQGRSHVKVADLWSMHLAFFNRKLGEDVKSSLEASLAIVRELTDKNGKKTKSPYPFPCFTCSEDIEDIARSVDSARNKVSSL